MEARKFSITGLVFIALFFVSGQSLGDSISEVKVSLEHAAHLSHGERVNVSFKYMTNQSGGVRIFVRPMTKNQTSPDFAAHGSRIYNARSGRASGHFTISRGDVLVDRIRITIVAASGGTRLTHYVPAKLRFSAEPVKPQPMLQVMEPPVVEILGAAPAAPEGEVTRTILPNGDVEIRYPDGRRKILFDGGFRIVYPDGREELYSFMSVQPTTPPMLPSQPAIVEWLEGMNNGLLNTIRTLVGGNQQAVDYYVAKENDTTSNLYEKMWLRNAYIDRLLNN